MWVNSDPIETRCPVITYHTIPVVVDRDTVVPASQSQDVSWAAHSGLACSSLVVALVDTIQVVPPVAEASLGGRVVHQGLDCLVGLAAGTVCSVDIRLEELHHNLDTDRWHSGQHWH